MWQALIAGFALGFSLILAIGAQNAFVLRQGLRREHVFVVCLTCAFADAFLIAVGVGGFGSLAQIIPGFGKFMQIGGAVFLFVYGIISFRRAFQGGNAMEAGQNGGGSARRAVLTALALAFLNPHVYLDTVVLLGSVSAQYDPNRLSFGVGAVIASFAFFFALGYGARILAPYFARPAAWRLLDIFVGIVMWSIALALILS